MRYKFEFNDWDLRELDSILIQPKKDGNGYTVHKTMKPEPGDGWDEWRNSITASFEKAQENKEVSERNKAIIEELKAELNRVRSVGAVQLNDKNNQIETLKAELNRVQLARSLQLSDKDNQIEKLQNNCKHLEEKVDDLQTELNNVEESASAWKKKFDELYKTLKIQNFQNCSDSMKMHHAGILSKTERLDEFKSVNNFDIWEARFLDHKTLNQVFKDYFLVDHDDEYEFNELIRGIESAFRKFNRDHELNMFEFFVYIGYYHFLRLLDSLVCKDLFNTKWTESNPFDCNLNIVPPCGEDDNTVSYYIVFSTAPKYVGNEN